MRRRWWIYLISLNVIVKLKAEDDAAAVLRGHGISDPVSFFLKLVFEPEGRNVPSTAPVGGALPCRFCVSSSHSTKTTVAIVQITQQIM